MIVLSLLGIAFLSALIPVINLEVYLGGLALFGDEAGAWDVAVLSGVAAVGQMAGKLLFYLAGRGVLRLPARLKPSTEKVRSDRRQRTVDRLARWQERIRTSPWMGSVLVGASASVGLPPFAIVAVFAGTLRIPLPVFLIAGTLGRWARFAVVLGVVGVAT